MSERLIPSVEKSDIVVPTFGAGESILVLQRHERYQRDLDQPGCGSLLPEYAAAAYADNRRFFTELLATEPEAAETMLFFLASDTQYAGQGYRSLETAQLAQDAAADSLRDTGLEPAARIINLHPAYKTNRFEPMGWAIRPDAKIREPQIFDRPEYVDYLRSKYGHDTGLSPEAWAAHEADVEKDFRELVKAESVFEMLARTKQSVSLLDRYAKVFHAHTPGKRLLFWAVSHYDTISPLVKDATQTSFDQHLPVDYGAGVIIKLGTEVQPVLSARGQTVPLRLGHTALNHYSTDVRSPE